MRYLPCEMRLVGFEPTAAGLKDQCSGAPREVTPQTGLSYRRKKAIPLPVSLRQMTAAAPLRHNQMRFWGAKDLILPLDPEAKFAQIRAPNRRLDGWV